MTFKLRPYQDEAVNAVIRHIKASVSSCMIVLPTGSGKSAVVASIANWLWDKTGKRVLCVAPTSELVVQNRLRFLSMTGEPASMFSASAGQKNLRHPVVFGTPGTVKGSIEMFGEKYGAIIIDECHGITPTIRFIINEMKRRNPKLRVIGMTATPYRMNTGYIYKDHYQDGQHRYLGAKLAREQGYEIARIECKDFTGSEADRVAFMVSSSQGKALDPFERANAYRRLKAFGWTNDEIAKKVGRSVSDVQMHLSLQDVPEEIKKRVTGGQLSYASAVAVTREHGEKAAEVVEQAHKEAKAAGKDKITAKQLNKKPKKEADVPRIMELLKGATQAAFGNNDYLCLQPGVIDELMELINGR